MQLRKSIVRNNYISVIPMIITSASILLGIFNGLSASSNKELSDGILDILMRIVLFDETDVENSWMKIIVHNMTLSLYVGLLGLISVGMFAAPYLFSWWSLWIELIKVHSITKCFFVIPESIGITIVVLSIIFVGLNYIVYRKFKKYQIVLFLIGLALILIGGVIEHYEISVFAE